MKINIIIVASILLIEILFTNMNEDNQGELIIEHDEFGKELFHIENARYNYYEVEENRWEFVISIDTDYAARRVKTLEEVVHAEPSIEVTAILNVPKPEVIGGTIISQKSGYDYSRDEYLSHIYYFSHETVEDFRFEILTLNESSLIAKMDGNCVINGSNGLKPDSKLSTITEFKLDKSLKRTTQ